MDDAVPQRRAEQVAAGDMDEAGVLLENLRLRTFSGARSAKKNDIHSKLFPLSSSSRRAPLPPCLSRITD